MDRQMTLISKPPFIANVEEEKMKCHCWVSNSTSSLQKGPTPPLPKAKHSSICGCDQLPGNVQVEEQMYRWKPQCNKVEDTLTQPTSI